MPKILIIDDSRVITHFAKTILVEGGHEVLLAHDGAEGLRVAGSGDAGLILLDVIMPGMDGYEVCRQLKNSSATCNIPVIMLTSKAEPGDKVKGLELGAVDYVTKPFNAGELLARVGIHLRIKELHDALQEKNRQLQELANRDGLTGLYNHRYFQEQISKEFSRAQRYEHPLSCAMVDIDHFKKFNDAHGHHIGDIILKMLGGLITQALRGSDLAARYGGEEFAIILVDTPFEGAMDAVDRLRRLVEKHEFKADEESLRATISVGIATFPDPRFQKPEDLVQAADKALYAAKQKGRNRAEFF